MTSEVGIIAVGARTPVGLRAAPAAAAVRAGISALGEHPFMVDQVGDPMPGALDSRLDPYLMGPERMVALAGDALREAAAPLMRDGLAHRLAVPVYVALPEIRPGFSEEDAAAVQSGIADAAGASLAVADVRVLVAGHAAGAALLAAGVAEIQRGACEACLVGGVDSYFHPDTMEWLDANRQLAGAVSRSGLVPGEGAGFCLLMHDRAAERLRLATRARIRSTATGHETKLIRTTDVCLGEGLTETVRTAVGALQLPSERIEGVFCDMNGDRYRAEEWGFVALRLSQYFDDPMAYVSPADCWGDVGAASVPLFVMLACEAAARGHAAGPRLLTWASSEGGLRGASVLEFDETRPTPWGSDPHV
jgi:3-oxoacyl-[acyl-carrier-protein] synthase I